MGIYARKGNLEIDDQHFKIDSVTLVGGSGADELALAAKNRADLVFFLKTLTHDLGTLSKGTVRPS